VGTLASVERSENNMADDDRDGSAARSIEPQTKTETNQMAKNVHNTPPLNASASSRRAFLVQAAGAAAGGATVGASLPLLAPSAATAQSSDAEADPVFVAIEAHRKAAEALEQAREPWDEVDDLHPEARIKIGQYRERDITTIPNGRGGTTIEVWPTEKLMPIFASDGVDLRRHAPSGLTTSEVNAWIEERSQEIEAEQARVDAEWYQTAPGKLELAYSAAYVVERDRMWNLIWTFPTTIRGLAALLRYVNERNGAQEFIHNDEWLEAYDWTIERAVCALAGLPEPPMNDIVENLWDKADEETT
jgi:hypothetical protein